MVRAATYRTSKYDAKLVGDVIKNRIDAQRDSMVDQETNRFADLVSAEEACKNLLVGWGVSTVVVPFYLSFARQCYSINQKHQGAIAVTEMCIREASWVTRGLLPFYLQSIAFAVTAVDISSCT